MKLSYINNLKRDEKNDNKNGIGSSPNLLLKKKKYSKLILIKI